MYRVLARKYRPTKLDEVVGQDVAVRILKNAIALNRLHHAILLSGPMGVGKTSIARIIAKSLNCEKGISVDPCNRCESCRSIASGRSVDVLEIDGASNRRIEDARAIIESVKYPPLKSRYKIYIVDEVHMLTLEAFNALLKTIEEPPDHVKFIFATTAMDKVPETILSRCQIISLKRIPENVIKDKLKEIAQLEGVPVEDRALEIIAFASSGSLRVAEGFLDRCFVYAPDGVTADDAAKVVGVATFSMVDEYFKYLFARDTKRALDVIDRLYDEDVNFEVFGRQCLEYLMQKEMSVELQTALLGIYYAAVVDMKRKLDPLSVLSVATHKAIAAMGLEKIEKVMEKLASIGTSGLVLQDQGRVDTSDSLGDSGFDEPRMAIQKDLGDRMSAQAEDSDPYLLDEKVKKVLELFEGKVVSVEKING